jgi:hypothetical protein
VASNNANDDGSVGEFFTKSTMLDSPYTETGVLYIDWEHGLDELDQDQLLGFVDWQTAVTDDRGVFVKRLLNRRNQYVQWLEPLIEAGLIGNSVEPIPSRFTKASDGEILNYPLRRDTLTVTPMEPRMLIENPVALAAAKSLQAAGMCVPGLPCENEEDDEVDDTAVSDGQVIAAVGDWLAALKEGLL